MMETLLHLAWCNAHKMAPCWSRSWLDQSLNSGTMCLQSEVALLSIWKAERANQHNPAITMVSINIHFFWDVMLCCWVHSYRRFKGMWCLHLQVNYNPWKFDIHMSVHCNRIPNYSQLDATFLDLFISTDAVHVSGRSSSHYQEHITVHTASGTVNQNCC